MTHRVQVPHNQVLGFWVIVILVQVLGKYMIIRYLDPLRMSAAPAWARLQGCTGLDAEARRRDLLEMRFFVGPRL